VISSKVFQKKAVSLTRGLNEVGDLFCPCQFGAARFPRSGTRLIGTGLVGLLPNQPSIFFLKIVPGGTLLSANKWAQQTTHSIELPY
jgi:hypothetical protein